MLTIILTFNYELKISSNWQNKSSYGNRKNLIYYMGSFRSFRSFLLAIIIPTNNHMNSLWTCSFINDPIKNLIYKLQLIYNHDYNDDDYLKISFQIYKFYMIMTFCVKRMSHWMQPDGMRSLIGEWFQSIIWF